LKCGAGRRMEISWTDHLRNEGMLGRVKKDRKFLQKIKTRKANLRINCLINHVIEGKLEGRISDGKTRKKT
jgi:hypothetical protein